MERIHRLWRTVWQDRTLRAIFLGGTVLYLVVFLIASGDIRPSSAASGLTVVDAPLERMLESRGPFRFEPIAALTAGGVQTLISPLNIVIGGFLAVLVGLHAASGYAAVKRPAVCRKGSAGVFASVPGLLAGSACCGPSILFILGVQASAGILSAFAYLIPVTVALLIGGLWYQARWIVPEE